VTWATRRIDRLSHVRRRRRILDLLERRGGEIETVLFVCFGNRCRSPYAAALFKQALPAEVRGRMHVESAGFGAAGLACPVEAVSAARRFGVDLVLHRSNLLTPALARGADLIVAMDGQQRRQIRVLHRKRADQVIVLGDLDPEPIEARGIADPFGHTETTYLRTYQRLARCTRELALAISTFRSPPWHSAVLV
jgi:protein-tyrosine phosphatase